MRYVGHVQRSESRIENKEDAKTKGRRRRSLVSFYKNIITTEQIWVGLVLMGWVVMISLELKYKASIIYIRLEMNVKSGKFKNETKK